MQMNMTRLTWTDCGHAIRDWVKQIIYPEAIVKGGRCWNQSSITVRHGAYEFAHFLVLFHLFISLFPCSSSLLSLSVIKLVDPRLHAFPANRWILNIHAGVLTLLRYKPCKRKLLVCQALNSPEYLNPFTVWGSVCWFKMLSRLFHMDRESQLSNASSHRRYCFVTQQVQICQVCCLTDDPVRVFFACQLCVMGLHCVEQMQGTCTRMFSIITPLCAVQTAQHRPFPLLILPFWNQLTQAGCIQACV